jgi:hypothetical protein
MSALFGQAYALSAASIDKLPAALVLRRPEPRAVKVEGAVGEPVAGVRISMRSLYVSGIPVPDLPEPVAASLDVTSGADGEAALDFLAKGDQLVTVRVTADPIGTQEFQLVEQPGRAHQDATITLWVGPTSRLSGRVDAPRASLALRTAYWLRGSATLG